MKKVSTSATPDNESAFLRDGIVPLLLAFGYSLDEIFFDYSVAWLNDFYRVDVAVAPGRHAAPWLLVEVKLKLQVERDDLVRSMGVLSGFGKACGARGVMLLTQHVMSFATASDFYGESHRRLDAMTLALNQVRFV